MPYMYALCVCLMCMPYMYALYVCLICMPYMYALYTCLICMPYMYALYICLICMPYMYALWAQVADMEFVASEGRDLVRKLYAKQHSELNELIGDLQSTIRDEVPYIHKAYI
jgi:hypothetical protein